MCALPWERAIKLWGPQILAADPFLGRSGRLKNGRMVGHQLFLEDRLDINHGHFVLADSPWAIVSVQQARLRDRDVPGRYGDGQVKDIISTCISDWDAPGILYGKPAKACTARQIHAQVLAQLNAHLQGAGIRVTEDMVHTAFLDPGVRLAGTGVKRTRNDTQLFLNTIGCLDDRPTADTGIANLFVASDYVRKNMDVACMESANEAARRAVNALLDRSGSSASPARIYEQYDPPEFAALKKLDAARYRHGEPHILKTGGPLADTLFGLPKLIG